jgi:FkbM family methyltransferase
MLHGKSPREATVMNTKSKRFIKNHLWMVIPPSVRGPLTDLFVKGLPESERFRLGFPYVMGLLENLKKNGFAPQTVIDVGANVGDWSRMTSQVFPSAQFFMIEGNPDNEPFLRNSASMVGENSEYSILLLGPEEKGGVTFYKLGTGSSVLRELTTYDSSQVTLPMRTLDGFMESRHYNSPVLLKLDVQGFELQVLLAGTATLSRAEVVIMETSLLPYNENAPLFAEVVAFMAAREFLAFDFCGQLRRQTDDTLFQTDVVFVKKDSALRAPRRFWRGEP